MPVEPSSRRNCGAESCGWHQAPADHLTFFRSMFEATLTRMAVRGNLHSEDPTQVMYPEQPVPKDAARHIAAAQCAAQIIAGNCKMYVVDLSGSIVPRPPDAAGPPPVLKIVD